jgi:hypothetical protein
MVRHRTSGAAQTTVKAIAGFGVAFFLVFGFPSPAARHVRPRR